MTPSTAETIEKVLASYGQFLQTCDEDKSTLQQKFAQADFKKDRFDEARDFGRTISDLLHLIGQESELLRYLVV